MGLVAIFAGFVLINAVGRYSELQRVLIRFYAKVSKLEIEQGAKLHKELDAFDDVVLKCTGRGFRLPNVGDTRPRASSAKLAEEWAMIDVALINRVTRHEWLVLVFGSAGIVLALHGFALASRVPLVFALRSFATAVVVGGALRHPRLRPQPARSNGRDPGGTQVHHCERLI